MGYMKGICRKITILDSLDSYFEFAHIERGSANYRWLSESVLAAIAFTSLFRDETRISYAVSFDLSTPGHSVVS
jgi:hypothetical protein